MREMFFILIVWFVTCMYMFVKIHQALHLICTFTVNYPSIKLIY